MIHSGRRRPSSTVGCSTAPNNHRSSTSYSTSYNNGTGRGTNGDGIGSPCSKRRHCTNDESLYSTSSCVLPSEKEEKAESKFLRSPKNGRSRRHVVRSLAVVVVVGLVFRTYERSWPTQQRPRNAVVSQGQELRGSGTRLSLETRNAGSRSSSQFASVVEDGDYIFKRDLSRFDAAPIIVPEYKLAFFSVPKVACTTFKFLFRKMKGIEDWDNQDYQLILPHNPRHNNLKYLWDYSLEEANEIMTSPEWTRAIFIREPKRRFLSAFLDKAIGNDGWHVVKACCHKAQECQGIGPTKKGVNELLQMCHSDTWDSRQSIFVPQWNLELPCCPETKECREKAETIEGFLQTIQTCHDEHWSE
jgi:hypothetical protein